MRYGPENVPVEKLPPTLWPGGMITPLGDYDPEELEKLAARPQRIVPIPEDLTEARRSQLSGLAQYRGRSAEGNKRSLANLPRKMKMENLAPVPINSPTVPEGVQIPTPPNMIPLVPGTMAVAGKHLRRVLSQEEHRLFQEQWVKWTSAHPDWTDPEDEDDLITICMETVMMLRLQAAQRQKPTTDISEAYNQAFNRKQKARDNLGARRKDKNTNRDPAGPGREILNVAFMAGEFSPEKLAAKAFEDKQKAKQEEEEYLSNGHPQDAEE